MNVTSMLSRGYLQPWYNATRVVNEARVSDELAAQEQRVLAQERELKSASGPDAKVSTTYQYSTGPDGRRYVTGAEVSVEGKPRSNEEAERKKAGLDDKTDGNTGRESVSGGTDEETKAAVRELQRIEQEVVAHEAAHQASGGALAGGVTYSYTRGPDGRNYITGGEVSIQMPVSSDPEQTIRDMEQVQRAALAPGNPSGQDLSVAGKAAAAAARARQEVASKSKEDNGEESDTFSSGVSSVKAGLIFDSLHGENRMEQGVTPIVEELPDISMINPKEAYERNASSRGLWTWERGFERVFRYSGPKPRFEIAA